MRIGEGGLSRSGESVGEMKIWESFEWEGRQATGKSKVARRYAEKVVARL